jgi:hypothetical protein
VQYKEGVCEGIRQLNEIRGAREKELLILKRSNIKGILF